MATLTFPTGPEYRPHQTSPGRKDVPRVNVAEFGDGYMQVSGDGLNAIKTTWELVWQNEDNAVVGVIVEFLRSAGGYQPFYWTPPEEQTPSLWLCLKGWDRSNFKGLSQDLKVTFERFYGAAE